MLADAQRSRSGTLRWMYSKVHPADLDDALIAWFRGSGRILDVRTTSDPWAVLVAETMSQQTQIARVGPYWRRFLERWPNPASFATAPTRDLLEAWAGLGYNRRALALRDAARRIVAEHGGTVPADVEALEALPGVGPYTARAVAAGAFALPVAPVDVNVRRVVSRLTGERSPRAIQAEGDRLVAACRSGPALWVHAVMDLAATVCTRRDPRCADCPIAGSCRSRGTAGDETPDRGGAPSPAFERTNRWLRGRIVARAREAMPGSWVAFDGPIGDHDTDAVARALGDLAAEGFLDTDAGRARLRD